MIVPSDPVYAHHKQDWRQWAATMHWKITHLWAKDVNTALALVIWGLGSPYKWLWHRVLLQYPHKWEHGHKTFSDPQKTHIDCRSNSCDLHGTFARVKLWFIIHDPDNSHNCPPPEPKIWQSIRTSLPTPLSKLSSEVSNNFNRV